MTAQLQELAPPRPTHPVLRMVLRRLGAAVLTLLVLSVLVFAATSVLPGDAAAVILGRQATPEALAHLRAQLGTDQPAMTQYLQWLGGLLGGDLGTSAAASIAGPQVGVWSLVGGKLGNSVLLALIVVVPIVVLAMLLGVVAALGKGRWPDHLISGLTMIPAALPEFVLGSVLLAVFFAWLGVLPPVSLIPVDSSPLDYPSVLVLPALTVAGVVLGPAARMIRAGSIEALAADSVAVARLNGIPEPRVVRRYALRNALAPSIQVFGLIAQYLVGGLLIVEFLFGYPGIGKALVDAVTIHDNTVVRSVTMLLAAVYVVITIAADALVMLLVPRLRTGAA